MLRGVMQVAVALSKEWKPASVEGLPNVFTGGWVGYCGYDTVRYVYSSKGLPQSELSAWPRRAPLCSHTCFWKRLNASLLRSRLLAGEA